MKNQTMKPDNENSGETADDKRDREEAEQEERQDKYHEKYSEFLDAASEIVCAGRYPGEANKKYATFYFADGMMEMYERMEAELSRLREENAELKALVEDYLSRAEQKNL